MGSGPSQPTAPACAGIRRSRTKARITVVVRKRPLSADEIERSEHDILALVGGDNGIRVDEPRKNVCGVAYTEPHEFVFDRAYAEYHSNYDVYSTCVRSLVDAVFQQGARCACFAYGQTGSGKTYTMVGRGQMSQMSTTEQRNCVSGSTSDDVLDPGLLELASQDCFRWLQAPEFEYHYGLYVSFYEIYCNKVYDLLNRRQLVRALETNSTGGVIVKDLKQLKVEDVDTLLRVISSGLDQRIVGTNSKNNDSSRGHAILTLEVKNEHSKTNLGKLVFVDLAGSERGVDAMGSGKQTQTDGAGINRSLLALKECIRALDLQSAHVPFRDSELTKVLRDMFVGSTTRTLMISCVSPSATCCEQTLNTLRYADRVKAMRRNGAAALGLAEISSNGGNLTARGSPPPGRAPDTARAFSGALSARGPHLLHTPETPSARGAQRKTVANEETPQSGNIRHRATNASIWARHSLGPPWESQSATDTHFSSSSRLRRGSPGRQPKGTSAATRSTALALRLTSKNEDHILKQTINKQRAAAVKQSVRKTSSALMGSRYTRLSRPVTSSMGRVSSPASTYSSSGDISPTKTNNRDLRQQKKGSFLTSSLSSSCFASVSVSADTAPHAASPQRLSTLSQLTEDGCSKRQTGSPGTQKRNIVSRGVARAARPNTRGSSLQAPGRHLGGNSALSVNSTVVCHADSRGTLRRKPGGAVATRRRLRTPPVLVAQRRKSVTGTRDEDHDSASSTATDDSTCLLERQLDVPHSKSDDASAPLHLNASGSCKYFPPREKNDLVAAASLLRKRYREWNFPLMPENDGTGKYLEIQTAIKMLKGIAALPAQEVHKFYERYHGKMHRFYNDLVHFHFDCVQAQSSLSSAQKCMLQRLEKTSAGVAPSSFELDTDYLTDLRSVVQTQLSMAIRLGKRVAEMERMLSLQKTLISGYQSASASEAEFYAKPFSQQTSSAVQDSVACSAPKQGGYSLTSPVRLNEAKVVPCRSVTSPRVVATATRGSAHKDNVGASGALQSCVRRDHLNASQPPARHGGSEAISWERSSPRVSISASFSDDTVQQQRLALSRYQPLVPPVALTVNSPPSLPQEGSTGTSSSNTQDGETSSAAALAPTQQLGKDTTTATTVSRNTLASMTSSCDSSPSLLSPRFEKPSSPRHLLRSHPREGGLSPSRIKSCLSTNPGGPTAPSSGTTTGALLDAVKSVLGASTAGRSQLTSGGRTRQG